nr:vWA domain-containing protein [uncultured Psychroserpens sp.]
MKTQTLIINFKSLISTICSVAFLTLILFLFSMYGNSQEILYNGIQTPTCTGGSPPSPACDLINLYEDDFPPYEITSLTATGGSTPYVWGASGLPDGISISSSGANNENLIISGVPEELGAFVITVTLTDNDANTDIKSFNIETKSGRRPVSVVFVLDRSGSMGSPPHDGSGTITRMDILKKAASLFVNKLDFFRAEGDEIALTYFETDVDDPLPGFGATLTNIDGNANSFTIDIDGQTPGGGTSMGPGLLAGKAKLPFPTEDSRQFILLFTDGEQNGSDLVNGAGTHAGATPLNNDDNSIQIVTIGTGAAAGMSAAIDLQAIANANTPGGGPGRNFLLQEEVNPTGTGSDFNAATSTVNFFDAFFQSMLSGSSPQTVAIKYGTMPSQTPDSKEFEINANINKIVFELITNDSEPFFTIEKDGVLVTPSTTNLQFISGWNNGISSLLAIINLDQDPISGLTSQGTWKLNMQSGTGGGQPYQIKAQVDDHLLDFSFEASSADFKVGDALNFDAQLAYNHDPIEDANITAFVWKPGLDLGNALAEEDIKFNPNSNSESGSVGYQKLLALMQSNPALVDSLGLKENVVSLTHTSGGNYSAQFTDTDVTGVYQIIAKITGSNATIGTYERTILRTVYVRFDDPDPEASIQEYNQNTPNSIQLLYTPIYLIGNETRFVGPGFAAGLSVTGTDIGNVSTTDNADGSYTIDVNVLNGNTDPDITINLSGVDVYNGQASSFDNGKNSSFIDKIIKWITDTLGIPAWLAWLLLILLIILIIWLIRKLKN